MSAFHYNATFGAPEGFGRSGQTGNAQLQSFKRHRISVYDAMAYPSVVSAIFGRVANAVHLFNFSCVRFCVAMGMAHGCIKRWATCQPIPPVRVFSDAALRQHGVAWHSYYLLGSAGDKAVDQRQLTTTYGHSPFADRRPDMRRAARFGEFDLAVAFGIAGALRLVARVVAGGATDAFRV